MTRVDEFDGMPFLQHTSIEVLKLDEACKVLGLLFFWNVSTSSKRQVARELLYALTAAKVLSCGEAG